MAGVWDLLVARPRNLLCQLPGERGRRCLVERSAHHQRAVLDAAGLRAEVHRREREAGAREALRVNLGELRFAFGNDVGVRLGEGGREHAADRGIEHAFHAFGGDFGGHATERHLRGLGERGERVGDDQRAEALAVADGELEGDEGAEAVAEDGGVGWELERVHDAGDVVGMIPDAVQKDGRGRAKAGKVDARHAMLLGEARQHQVEDGELGEERVDQQQVGAGAALVVFDLGGA